MICRTLLILVSSFSLFAQVGTDYISLDSKSSTIRTFKNLRLYPVVAGKRFIERNSLTGKYITLKDALEKGLVKISEKIIPRDSTQIPSVTGEMINRPRPEVEARVRPNARQDSNYTQNQVQVAEPSYGGQVNTLVIENLSQDTIYLMAGDVVQGGKQDRIVGKDVLILPGSKEVDLSVFCVEKGRWRVGDDSTHEFKGYYNVVSNAVRSTVQKDANQSKVWSKVDEITTQNKAGSSTSTYSALDKSEDFVKQNEEYVNFFENQFENSPDVIGFIACTGDSVLGTDIFCNPELFRKQYKTLIHSYITDAITFGKKVDIKNDKVENYFKDIIKKFSNELPAGEENQLKFKNHNEIIHFYNQ